ncbi:hypothetical protein J3R82DRAFT_3110 [Butyriboletus roseoflavus]|nr:hypothetical protein J3R82DRAFT_3110 [Butyriboletus roseoflavus]
MNALSKPNQPVNKHDNLTNIADTTLKAIEAGSITFANSYLDLAAKVRFSNHNTRYYPPNDTSASRWTLDVPKLPSTKTQVSILEIPTLAGARLLYDTLSSLTSFGRIAVLNFASATRPGGGFLGGAQAQEESIARSSTLYPSLMTNTAQEFYKLHLRDRRGGFYHHAMIYSPSVVIFRNDAGEWVTPFEVDVLTCAAVNANDVRNKNGTHADHAKVESTIESTMKERMGRILSLMEQQGAKSLVLGSFGTGVFRNSVKMVARIWADLLTSKGARYRSSFDHVVFAILGTSTFTTFKHAFENPTST